MKNSTTKNLPIDFLRSFVAIVEYGGFTQAGEVIGRSQAAVSLQIKKLEDLLNLSLFTRNGHSFELTSAGEVLLSYAKQMLALNDRALMTLENKSVEGLVRLGIPSEFATTLLPQILSRFAADNPNVNLEVNCDLSKNLLMDLESGTYDLVVGLHTNPQEAGKNLMKTDELVWVTSVRVDFAKYATIPVIAAPDGCIYRRRAVEELQKANVDWRIVYTIQDLSGIKSALDEGLGVTVLAASTVPKNLKIIPNSTMFPALGKIGISMFFGPDGESEASIALGSYIESALMDRINRSTVY